MDDSGRVQGRGGITQREPVRIHENEWGCAARTGLRNEHVTVDTTRAGRTPVRGRAPQHVEPRNDDR